MNFLTSFQWAHAGFRRLQAGGTLLGLLCLLAGVLHAADSSTYAERVAQSQLFSPSLMWVGEQAPTESESSALWQILSEAEQQPLYERLPEFVAAHPRSSWTPSLCAHMAKMHRAQGRYTVALREWEQAWAGVRAFTNSASQSVAEFTLAHWSQLLASLGRTEELSKLFQETGNWKWQDVNHRAIFAQSRDGYHTMLNYPGVSYRCGTFALTRVAQRLGCTNASAFQMIDIASPSNGFSMSALVSMSESNRLGLVAVERTSGSEVIVPSVIHWRQNHYAAVLGKEGPLYWVADPTFGESRWMDAEVLNAEASGKFMVPQTNVPAGWKLLAQVDTDRVFGKGQPSTIHHYADRGCNMSPGGAGAPSSGAANPGGNKAVCIPCTMIDHSQDIVSPTETNPDIPAIGMPAWWVSEPYINLFVADQPLSYFQSDGSQWSLRWTYKQRDVYPLNTTFFQAQFPFGRGTGMTNAAWTHNYVSFIRFRDTQWDALSSRCGVQIPYTYYEAYVYLPGGAILPFRKSINPSETILSDDPSGMRLEPLAGAAPTLGGTNCGDDASIAGFRLVYPDGSQDVYNYAFRANTTCNSGIGGVTIFGLSEAFAYLKKRIDPQGRSTSICYESATNIPVRIKQVIDFDGRTNSFSYANASFKNLPTQVTDPYGRGASFTYDGSGRLTTLVDAAGVSSSIGYTNDGSGFITYIATPYGNTFFGHFDAPDTQSNTNQGNSGGHDRINRYLSILDRDGSRELYMYRYDSSFRPDSYAAGEVPVLPAQLGNSTFDNGTATSSGPVTSLKFRNSFYWGKIQMQLVTNWWNPDPALFTATDYRYARLRHWLDQDPISGDTGTLVSDRISLEVAPSLDGTNEGFKTWYDYVRNPGVANYRVGGSHFIGAIAQVLPDGTSQVAKYDYVFPGHPASRVRFRTSSYTTPYGTNSVRTNTYAYATNGIDLTSHTFPDAKTERFAWDAFHQLVYHTNAENEVTGFGYNGGRLGVIAWPNGFSRVFSYAYDGLSVTHPNYRMADSVTDFPVGRTIYFPEWTNGLPKRIIGDHSLNITNTWDSFNRMTSQSYSDGTFISNRYNRLDLSATKDRLGSWTYFTYDAFQRLSAVTNANTNVTQFGYCGCGALQSVTDATLTNTTTIAYDLQLRPISITLPDGSSMANGYDALGRRTSVTQGGATWTFHYNNQNLVAAVSNSFGQVQRVVYDVRDRPVQVTDAAGITLTNTFDGIHRLLTRSWPDNGVERFVYNTNGLVRYTNQLGFGTRFAYDSSGRLSAITNANTEVVRFTYDVWSDLRELIDGKNQTNKWTYDIFGRATNKVDASGQTVFGYSYDANNRLTNRWTPANGGVNTRFAYDPVGNLLSVHYPGSSISYLYDPLNRVRQMNDAAGQSTFTYTRAGQLASEDGPWSNDTVASVYSQLLRTNLTFDTWTQSYRHDAGRRLTNITSGAGAFGYQFAGASHLRSRLTLPNGASIQDAYDYLAQLTNTALLNASLSTLNVHGYSYDQLGQRTIGTSSTGPAKWNYTYDPIGQLKSATPYDANSALIAAQRLGYGYDAAGNLSYRTNDMAVRSFIIDKLNQLTNVGFASPLTVSGVTTTNATNVTVNGLTATLNADGTYSATVPIGGGTNSVTAIGYERFGRLATNSVSVAGSALQYDANGNLLFDGQKGFAYDPENQLTNIVVTNSWKSQFVYDGFGRRRIRREFTWTGSAWSQTNEVRYVFDGLLPIQERDSNNAVKVTYTRGLDLSGGMQGAGGIGGLLARTDASGSAFYHADGNGNITALLDSSQNIVAQYAYDPFGNLLSMSGSLTSANTMRFSSMEAHAQSGLMLYTFRAYSPSLQRFTQADPIGLGGGLNMHRFNANAPVNLIDPYGLENWFTRFSDTVSSPITKTFITGPAEVIADRRYSDFIDQAAERHGLNPKEFLMGLNERRIATPGGMSSVSAVAEQLEGAAELYVALATSITPTASGVKCTSAFAEKVLSAKRAGSGLKADAGHRAASYLTKEQLEAGQVFLIKGGDGVERTLLQTEGLLNGKPGIFEYIVDPSGAVTHQRFIEGGKITGVPNQKP